MSHLAAFGRKRYVSQSALSEVLQEIKNAGLPEGVSRSSVKRARERELASWSNSIGDAITHMDFECVDTKGKKTGTVKLPFVHPWWFLQVCCKKCPSFIRYFQQYLVDLGTSPNDAFEQL